MKADQVHPHRNSVRCIGDPPLSRVEATSTEGNQGKRKPVEGDCPICFMEFGRNEEIVWCKAACGNNIHKKCFDQWAATTRQSGVRCVYWYVRILQTS